LLYNYFIKDASADTGGLSPAMAEYVASIPVTPQEIQPIKRILQPSQQPLITAEGFNVSEFLGSPAMSTKLSRFTEANITRAAQIDMIVRTEEAQGKIKVTPVKSSAPFGRSPISGLPYAANVTKAQKLADSKKRLAK